jgi:uncharacterized membrane protein
VSTRIGLVRIVKVVVVLGVALVMLGVLARTLVPRFMICLPASLGWTSQPGGWVIASADLGRLPSGKVYWHIDRFPDRAAAEASQGPNSAVVELYGAIWLLAITSDRRGEALGQSVAVVGPLPIAAGTEYTADYMEGRFSPGMRSIAYHHLGPEAFYNIDGEFCLETPGKRTVVGAGFCEGA